jgi:hypothetical protein
VIRSRQRWTPADDALLRDRYPTETAATVAEALGRPLKAIYVRASELGLRKAPGVIAEVARERTAQPGHGSEATRFKPGQPGWNTGIRGVTGLHEKSRQHWFRSGKLNGKAAQQVLPVGSYRMSADGYLERKFSEASGSPSKRWTGVHRLVWMEANGPIPDGYVVAFRPGRFTTDVEKITLDALELVSRVDLMRRNSVHTVYGPEVARLVQLRGAITRQINRKSKDQP